MSDAIAHRGPDDAGLYCHGPIGLGHRRLAIIDLSPAGHQPMSNRTKRFWITFNGEIYNYQELRVQLEREGYAFQSHTDTEVILALYEKHGVGCLQYLRGMFAFALWDEQEKSLFLARDRLGKKPLKYALTEKGITFASELKSILQDPTVSKEVDETAIHHALSLQYVPGPQTGFLGIQKLPPAHYFFWKNGQWKIERYWNLDFSKKQNYSEKEWMELLRHELNESVKLRMISDVPVGVFLSGGVDSSIVTTLMAEQSTRPIKTFSIRFQEKTHDEAEYIHCLVQKLGTQHREWTLKPEVMHELPDLVKQFEEPYADPAALPTYLMAREVSKEVKVALNGDGGDENFAGYRTYQAYDWDKNHFQKWPLCLRKSLSRLVQATASLSRATHLSSTHLEKLSQFLSHPDYSSEERFLNYVCFFTEDQKSRLYTPEFAIRMKAHATRQFLAGVFQKALANEALDRALWVDIHTHLPDNLLVKVDLATMAYGLESRSPFLDHVFMEKTAEMPSSLKVKGGTKKSILKKAFESDIPHKILYRPKQGFDLPLEDWFKKELKTYTHDILLSRKALDRGFFTREGLERLLADHASGKGYYGRQIWALLTLELWHQAYVD